MFLIGVSPHFRLIGKLVQYLYLHGSSTSPARLSIINCLSILYISQLTIINSQPITIGILKSLSIFNSLVNIYTKKPWHYPSKMIFKDFQVPSLYHVHALQLLINAFTHYDILNTNRALHPHNTRHFHTNIHQVNKYQIKHSPNYLSVKMFNKLPSDVKSGVFKSINVRKTFKNWVIF